MLCFEAANCHCYRLGRAVGKSRGNCGMEKDQDKKSYFYGKTKKLNSELQTEDPWKV